MLYLSIAGIFSLVICAVAMIYAVLKVNAEMDERVDQLHKQRNEF